MAHIWKRDCKSFPGVYACDIMTAQGYTDCSTCQFYEPVSKKILIIKFGAIGDVLRTTPLLQGIKKKYGDDIQITWVTQKECVEVLAGHKDIDRLGVYNESTMLKLQQEEFDVLFSFDITPPSTTLANAVKAKKKLGYFFDKDGHPSPYNKSAEYYLNRVFSNKINKENRKTYQQMMAEVGELNYDGEEYSVELGKEEKRYQQQFKERNNIKVGEKIVGINVGSGHRWKSKQWDKKELMKCIEKLVKYSRIMLLGGKIEEEYMEELVHELNRKRITVLMNDPNNSIKEFASVVDICETIITSDSLALHLAIGLKKKVIGLFFSTPPWEIEGYGRLNTVVSPLLDKYFYEEEHHDRLAQSIRAEDVENAFKQ